jgi:hypothetical protein
MNSSQFVLLVTLLLLGVAKTKGLKGQTAIHQNSITLEFPISSIKQRRAQEKNVEDTTKTKITTAPTAPSITGAPTAEPSIKPTSRNNDPDTDKIPSFQMTAPLTPFQLNYTTSEAKNIADVLTTYLEERMFQRSVIVSVKKITLLEYEGNIFTGSILLEEAEQFRNWKADVKGQQQEYLINQMDSLEQVLRLNLQDISLTVDVSLLHGKALDLKPFSIELSDQVSEPSVTYALSIYLHSNMYRGNATRRQIQEVKTLDHPLIVSVNLTASSQKNMSSKFGYDGVVELYLSDALEQKGKSHWESSVQKEEEYWLVSRQKDLKIILQEHAVGNDSSTSPSLVDILVHSDGSAIPTADSVPNSPNTTDQEADASSKTDAPPPTAPAWQSSSWLKGIMGGIVLGAVGIAGALLWTRKKYARPTGRKRGARSSEKDKKADPSTNAV